jgi:hypothetical protein
MFFLSIGFARELLQLVAGSTEIADRAAFRLLMHSLTASTVNTCKDPDVPGRHGFLFWFGHGRIAGYGLPI